MSKKTTFDSFFDMAMIQENGCWEYASKPHPCGYCYVRYQGRKWAAHQLSHYFCVSDNPDRLHVLHTCDNRRCVNPDHLYLGTHQQNMRDRDERGRLGDRKGSANGRALLCEDDARDIKNKLAIGITCAELAEEYKVSWGTIKYIKMCTTWRHV